MKKIILMTAALLIGVAVMAQDKLEDAVQVKGETHNFGKIKNNVPVTHFFEIKNIGDKPLVVENASATCGCTVPERPEKPIMPGETGKLKIVFDAKAVGPINKEVYVKFAGIEQTKTLYIKGEVVAN